jgi:hypothetical protein
MDKLMEREADYQLPSSVKQPVNLHFLEEMYGVVTVVKKLFLKGMKF